jgi:hypothetical protein
LSNCFLPDTTIASRFVRETRRGKCGQQQCNRQRFIHGFSDYTGRMSAAPTFAFFVDLIRSLESKPLTAYLIDNRQSGTPQQTEHSEKFA